MAQLSCGGYSGDCNKMTRIKKLASEAFDYDCFLKVLSTSRVFADFVSLSLPVGADRDSLSAEPWILYRIFRPGQAIGSLVFSCLLSGAGVAFAFAVIS